LFLGTESEVKELLDRITERAKQLKCDAEDLRRLNSSHLCKFLAGYSSSPIQLTLTVHFTAAAEKQKEEKLLLLLWDAKSKLFVQAVHLRAEREPIINSKTMGARLGTKLKEKIFKAVGD
jgi:cell division septum initiation protein DivIVA